MSVDKLIPMPKEWGDLTAQGTRFSLLCDLWDITHWNDKSVSQTTYKDFADYCFFFFDDFMFKDDPTTMIGESLYSDEIEYINKFISIFEKYVDSMPEELSFGIVEKSKLNMPVEVIDTAKILYEKLIEKGNPYIENYKNRPEN